MVSMPALAPENWGTTYPHPQEAYDVYTKMFRALSLASLALHSPATVLSPTLNAPDSHYHRHRFRIPFDTAERSTLERTRTAVGRSSVQLRTILQSPPGGQECASQRIVPGHLSRDASPRLASHPLLVFPLATHAAAVFLVHGSGLPDFGRAESWRRGQCHQCEEGRLLRHTDWWRWLCCQGVGAGDSDLPRDYCKDEREAGREGAGGAKEDTKREVGGGMAASSPTPHRTRSGPQNVRQQEEAAERERDPGEVPGDGAYKPSPAEDEKASVAG